MKKKEIFIAFFGIIISILLLYLSFKNINFLNLLEMLKKARIPFILLFFVSTFFEMIFRTLKWYLILNSNIKVDFYNIFKFEIISLGINNILPFRMGELTKMFLVAKFYSVSKTTVISTIFIERILDSIILFSLLLLYSKIGGINILINTTSIFIILNLAILIIIIGFVFSEKIIETQYFKKIEIKHPKIYSLIIKFKNGGKCFKDPKLAFAIFFVGIIQWSFDVLNNYFIAKSLEIKIIDYFKAAITVFAGSLSSSIPSMPGYFGNYEYAISRVCMSWGIEKELSILFPAMVHILGYILITLTAIIYIYSLGFNFKKILKISKMED
ncbi:MAG: flippase-like domain-containing protein [Elusimicrobiota bacterium]